MFTYDKCVNEEQESYNLVKHISYNKLIAIDNIGGFIDCPADIPSSAVALKVKDDSMEDDGIRKNNFAIVRLTSAPIDKSIVLFVSRASGEYYIRRYFRDGHIVSMMPSSQSGEYSPVRYDERDTDYEIVGYVEKFLTSPM
jgi:SOS-response transcriptional repressor LexA